jgi:hypothetical protein
VAVRQIARHHGKGRYHGVLAPDAKLRARVVPQGPPAQAHVATGVAAPAECEQAEPLRARAQHIDWARLLKRVFDIDLRRCPQVEPTVPADEQPEREPVGPVDQVLVLDGPPGDFGPSIATAGFIRARAHSLRRLPFGELHCHAKNRKRITKTSLRVKRLVVRKFSLTSLMYRLYAELQLLIGRVAISGLGPRSPDIYAARSALHCATR